MPFLMIFILNLVAAAIAYHATITEKQAQLVLRFGLINASLILLAWIIHIYLAALGIVPNEIIKQ